MERIQFHNHSSKDAEIKENKSIKISTIPNLTKTLLQSFTILSHHILTLHLKEYKPHLLIQPDLGNIEVFEFLKGKELIDNGEKAALQNLKQIQKLVR